MNTYKVEAGMVLFVGKTVWSMPKHLRDFRTKRCINPRNKLKKNPRQESVNITNPRSQPSHSSSRSSRSARPHTSQNVMSGTGSSSTCSSWWATGIRRYTTPSQPSRTRISRNTWRSTGHVFTFWSICTRQTANFAINSSETRATRLKQLWCVSWERIT